MLIIIIVVVIIGLETLIRMYSSMPVLSLPPKVSSLSQQAIYGRQEKELSQ